MKTNEVKKTPIEIVDRTTILGGSDANRIMRGDWHTLWLEKTKREEPEDLSWNLPVQIGLHTETVNKMFFENEIDLSIKGIIERPILGPKGNKEFLIYGQK